MPDSTPTPGEKGGARRPPYIVHCYSLDGDSETLVFATAADYDKHLRYLKATHERYPEWAWDAWDGEAWRSFRVARPDSARTVEGFMSPVERERYDRLMPAGGDR